MIEEACRELIEELKKKEYSKKDFLNLKTRIGKKYGIKGILKDSEILGFATEEEKKKLKKLLVRKPTRSLSGISVVAVMSKPAPCPHGTCAYCPKGDYAPQSYTGEEPAALRARRNEYDPVKQVENRLKQLRTIGHPTDKIELIVMGGTFPAQPIDYQEGFIKGCFDAMVGESGKNLEESVKAAEVSATRPVGVTFETRPDYCKQKEIDEMLKLGATRVELGVQTVYNDILEKVERKHYVKDSIEATRLLKDAGIKVNYHMMPGLPGSDRERDIDSFKEIFSNPDFKPDMIKIYPTLVLKGTKLYDWWKAGEYKPLGSEEAAEIIAESKRFVPPWARIMRVTRDIPATLIDEGVKKSNLRQLVEGQMKVKGIECSCIRCREVGHRFMKDGISPDNIEIRELSYDASNGKEIFISAEDFEKKILVGYLRLRYPSTEAFRPEIAEDSAIVRELHVYGPEVKIGKEAGQKEFQHKGWGKKLLERAEEIAKTDEKKNILVRSGIGARQYYRKLGYLDSGAYVKKNI
jgi:elongator complex protein 3